jgi:hypothetical protein
MPPESQCGVPDVQCPDYPQDPPPPPPTAAELANAEVSAMLADVGAARSVGADILHTRDKRKARVAARGNTP